MDTANKLQCKGGLKMKSEMTTQYNVTRMFISGFMKGLKYTDTTAIKFEVGFECKKPIAGDPYVITKVEKVI